MLNQIEKTKKTGNLTVCQKYDSFQKYSGSCRIKQSLISVVNALGYMDFFYSNADKQNKLLGHL
jgi:hypothetical protein